MLTLDQALDLTLLVVLALLASAAGVLMFGPRRWSAFARPLVASLLLAVVVPIIAVSAFDISWNTTVLAVAVVVIALVAAVTRERRTVGPNDDWP
jgi:uncharacterized membrane protein YhaH (DUF805 family)